MVRRFAMTAALGVTLSACNIFGFMSPPTNDVQRLSMARACFDAGDFVCANKYYGDMATSSQVAKSELILAQLDDLGVGFGTILRAFANRGSTGAGFLNALANEVALSPYGDTGANAEERRGNETTRRVRLFAALKSTQDITNSQLRAFSKFLTSAALVGAILSEQADSGRLEAGSIAADATACADLADGVCAVAGTACDSPTGKRFEKGTVLDPTVFTYDFDGAPTLQMLNFALYHLVDATASLGAGGVSGSTNVTATALSTAGNIIDSAPACYRQTLLNQGIGGS